MFPSPVQNLINELAKLPDIGPRQASRLVFYLLNQEQSDLDILAQSVKELKDKTQLCEECFGIASKDKLCSICQDSKRNREIICVVETVLNIPILEKTRRYNGLYHVLGGLISPANGLGPQQLKIEQLFERAKKNKTREIIFALSPTTEGDTTILYTERVLAPLKIKTSRLARGLSFGSDLQYIDENTLTNALENRK